MRDKRDDQVPIRADMATIVNGPTGMVEASIMSRAKPPLTSSQLAKRKELKDMLVKQLCKQHGSSALVSVVITREVETSALLRSGKLTPAGLKALEESVAAAVRATKPTHVESMKPRPNYAPEWTGSELADKVKQAANWTDVAMHRASYYSIEQERKRAEKEQKKHELREQLSHQMALEQHRSAARKQLVQEDARQIVQNLKEFEADMAKEAAVRQSKAEAQRVARAAQLREQAARKAANERLLQLEDAQLLEHLKKEQERDRQRKLEKQRANDEYHRATAKANIESRGKREEEQAATWAEDQRLNATWKAMLDKQEADRNAQYSNLRERIRKMQMVYANTAGADLERRMKEEEAQRDAYVAAHEAALDEKEAERRARIKAQNEATTAFLDRQIALKQEGRRQAKADEAEYFKVLQADAAAEAKKAEEKALLAKARTAQQLHVLNEQVALRRTNAAADPGASEMTPLEATLNRPLLVSIVQHKHNSSNPLT
jgi:hypothetical protein